MSEIITYRRLEHFEPLFDAETALLHGALAGDVAVVGDGRRPDGDSPIAGGDGANLIRAHFIRYLALGGCADARPHEFGPQLRGAWIEGELNVSSCALSGSLALHQCRFDSTIACIDSTAVTLSLFGSQLVDDGVGLEADRLTLSGDLVLSQVETGGQIRFPKARISGDVLALGAVVTVDGGAAIVASGARIDGDAKFESARPIGEKTKRPFRSDGCVTMLDATIGGSLSFRGAQLANSARASSPTDEHLPGVALLGDGVEVGAGVFLDEGFAAKGEVRLFGATIKSIFTCEGGRFENPGGDALNAAGATIVDFLYLRRRPSVGGAPSAMFDGRLDLTRATTGALIDDRGCWPKRGDLRVDGFVYERLAGEPTPKTANARIDWLRRQSSEHLTSEFRMQPWEQLERVFRDQGDTLEARRIGQAREWSRFRARRHWFHPTDGEGGWSPAQRVAWGALNWAIHPFIWLYGALVGFGYFTARALIPTVVLWALGAWIFAAAWNDGAFAPPHPMVLQSAAWGECVDAPRPAECWAEDGRPGAYYYGFSPWLYSFDVFLPILTIEQEASWLPTRGRGRALSDRLFGPLSDGAAPGWLRRRLDSWGAGDRRTTIGDLAWAYRLFHEIAGYVLVGFIAAGAARLVRER